LTTRQHHTGLTLNRNREEVFAATAGMVEANIGGSDLPAQVRRLYEYSEPSKLIGLRNDLVVVNEELLDYLRRHPELLYELHPRRFEEVIAAIWSSLGYEVTLTPRSRDGGKDLYAVQRTLAGDLLYIIECKRYSPDKPVGVEIVRGVYGVSQQERATMGVVATTSYFTKDAQQFQRMVKYQLSLTDYRDLTAWLNRLQK
jgi:restriction endonuclease Mrr